MGDGRSNKVDGRNGRGNKVDGRGNKADWRGNKEDVALLKKARCHVSSGIFLFTRNVFNLSDQEEDLVLEINYQC
jgi:hypothetical protein